MSVAPAPSGRLGTDRSSLSIPRSTSRSRPGSAHSSQGGVAGTPTAIGHSSRSAVYQTPGSRDLITTPKAQRSVDGSARSSSRPSSSAGRKGDETKSGRPGTSVETGRRKWHVLGAAVAGTAAFKAAGSSRQTRRDYEMRKRNRIMAQHRHPMLPAPGGLRKTLNFISGDFERPSPVGNVILIGDRADAQNRERLIQLGVTHILNTAKQLPGYHEDDFMYLHLPLMDGPDCDIRPHFPAACAFIDDAVAMEGRVLVHCVAGVSRSVTIAIAWLMFRQQYTLQTAMAMCLKSRPIAHPNEAFLVALAQYEVELFQASSVAHSGDPLWNFYQFNRVKGGMPRAQQQRPACIML